MTALLATGPARSQVLDTLIPPDVAGLATEPDVTVLGRRRPAYDGIGVRAGAFVIQPSVAENVGYESNVLGTSTPRGSATVETQAALAASTDQSRGNASASLSVDDVRYTEQPGQSHTNWSAQLGGAYFAGRDVLAVQYSHQNLAQTLQNLDVSRFLNQALSYQVDDAQVSYRMPFARTFIVPALEVAAYKFDSGLANGVVYNQNFRNRVVVQPSVTVGYELAPRRNVIAVVRNGTASYSTALTGTAKHDYNDTAVLGGVDYDVSHLIRLRLLAGYEVRTFNSSQYKNLTAPVVEASLTWNVSGLTTVTGTATRSVQDSSDTSSAAVTESVAALRVDHEYLRNVLLQANASFAVDQYRGGGSQSLYSVGTGATYLLNRNMSVGGTYTFLRRSSGSSSGSSSDALINIAGTGQSLGGNYSDHRILLQLRLKL